jgi:hypothetical protein
VAPTPGEPNRPLPAAGRPPAGVGGAEPRADEIVGGLASLRSVRSGRQAVAAGHVVARAGEVARNVMYLADATAALRIYAPDHSAMIATLEEGDYVRVRGRMGRYRGEPQLQAVSAPVREGGTDAMPPPVSIRTGDAPPDHAVFAEALGVLAEEGTAWRLDDGSGAVAVRVPRDWSKPSSGEVRQVRGILALVSGRAVLVPRRPSDLGDPGLPLRLPQTGGRASPRGRPAP